VIVIAKFVGIIGAGEITRKSHLPVLLNMEDVRIAWVYDRRPEQAQSLALAYGVRAIPTVSSSDMQACDAVLLAIPVNARAEYLDALAASGTAVLCEKPFATSLVEHDQLVARFPLYALGAGFMRRFFRSMRRIVSEQMFGALLKIEISEGDRSKGSGIDQSFLDDPRVGAARGVLTDLGSHSVDLALFVSSAHSFEVQSCMKILDGAVDRKVTAVVSLHGDDGRSTRPIEMSYGVSWLDRQTNRIVLTFAQATVWSDLSPGAEVFVGDPGAAERAIRLSLQKPAATTYNQAFYLEWRDFLEGVSAQRESMVSARSALLTTHLIDSLLRSPDSANA
jgi:predicted dehydrogenase